MSRSTVSLHECADKLPDSDRFSQLGLNDELEVDSKAPARKASLCFTSFLETFVHAVLYSHSRIPIESFVLNKISPCAECFQCEPKFKCSSIGTASQGGILIGTPEGYSQIARSSQLSSEGPEMVVISPQAETRRRLSQKGSESDEPSPTISLLAYRCALQEVQDHIKRTIQAYLLFDELGSMPNKFPVTTGCRRTVGELDGAKPRSLSKECCQHTLRFYENHGKMKNIKRIRIRTGPMIFISLDFSHPFHHPNMRLYTELPQEPNIIANNHSSPSLSPLEGTGTSDDPIVCKTPRSKTTQNELYSPNHIQSINLACEDAHTDSTTCCCDRTTMFIGLETVRGIFHALHEDSVRTRRTDTRPKDEGECSPVHPSHLSSAIYTPANAPSPYGTAAWFDSENVDKPSPISLQRRGPAVSPKAEILSPSLKSHGSLPDQSPELPATRSSSLANEFSLFAAALGGNTAVPEARFFVPRRTVAPKRRWDRFEDDSPAYDIVLDVKALTHSCPEKIQHQLRKKELTAEHHKDAQSDTPKVHRSTSAPSLFSAGKKMKKEQCFLHDIHPNDAYYKHCNDTFVSHPSIQSYVERLRQARGQKGYMRPQKLRRSSRQVNLSIAKLMKQPIVETIDGGDTDVASEGESGGEMESAALLNFRPLWENSGLLMSVVYMDDAEFGA